MNKSKWNVFAAILDIINIVLFVFSWFVIFGASFTDVFGATQGASSGTATFFYAMAWIGVVVNAISIYLSHKLHIKVTGGILGLIGNLCFGFTALLAFPAIVILIIACVFLFQQHPAKDVVNNNIDKN